MSATRDNDDGPGDSATFNLAFEDISYSLQTCCTKSERFRIRTRYREYWFGNGCGSVDQRFLRTQAMRFYATNGLYDSESL